MKLFQKLLAISLSSGLIFGSSSAYAESEETLLPNEKMETDNTSMLDEYFQAREDDFSTSSILFLIETLFPHSQMNYQKMKCAQSLFLC